MYEDHGQSHPVIVPLIRENEMRCHSTLYSILTHDIEYTI